MKEHKIGETFEYYGILLKVEEHPETNCKGCYFCNKFCCEMEDCTGEIREDETPVIFVQVKQ